MKLSRSTLADSYRYDGTMSYLVVYNHSAGKEGVYNAYIECADDPVRIGCELPLDHVKHLINAYEAEANKINTHPLGLVVGSRRQILRMRTKINAAEFYSYRDRQLKILREIAAYGYPLVSSKLERDELVARGWAERTNARLDTYIVTPYGKKLLAGAS